MMVSTLIATAIGSVPPLLGGLVLFLWRLDRRVYRIEIALGLKNGRRRGDSEVES